MVYTLEEKSNFKDNIQQGLKLKVTSTERGEILRLGDVSCTIFKINTCFIVYSIKEIT